MVVRGSKMVSDKMVLPSYQLIIKRFHFKITKNPRSTATECGGAFSVAMFAVYHLHIDNRPTYKLFEENPGIFTFPCSMLWSRAVK